MAEKLVLDGASWCCLMTPKKKIKIALDENRLSILGVQILFGFQLQAPFQHQFEAQHAVRRLVLRPHRDRHLGVYRAIDDFELWRDRC